MLRLSQRLIEHIVWLRMPRFNLELSRRRSLRCSLEVSQSTVHRLSRIQSSELVRSSQRLNLELYLLVERPNFVNLLQ
jgi:hypothetical protein